MPVYKAPVANTAFILQDVLRISDYADLPGFADVGEDTLVAILEEGAKLFENEWAPTNRDGDVQGCTRHADGRVTTPESFKAAYRAYCEGGWLGISVPEEFGGQNLPSTVNTVMQEFASSANLALAMYPGLTMGAVAALLVHGSQAQKETYLPKMIDGSWSGTMNLTEPHCGTDLGMIKTKAVPNGDGSYAITGTKIFISAGDHDLTENVVHLVLARIEGAPAGTKGISLFVVPKVLVNEDGSLGEKNPVSCGSLEHKMGIHGNATCVMNYDGAKGWLVGEENRGLAAMFVMMNEARLAVGVQGLAISEVAYQNAVAYAKDRLQGRALTGPKNPDGPADPIIVHPDVRRTLMTIRAINEAARALILYTALKSDVRHRSPDPAARQAADDFMGLLTPVVKGVFTDLGFDNAVKAQQMFGGHGYVEEWGMSQFVRDARITMIYEGANGIQAMDLVGRKLAKDGGRAVMSFFQEVGAFCEGAKADPEMAPYVGPLAEGLGRLQQATMWFMNNAMAKPDNAGAGATDYMHLFGLVAMGYMWGRMAKAALAKKDAPGMADTLVVGRFYMERLMPETAAQLARISAGADTTMALSADAF
ncbi:acyl-CoA dehydrogenase C-terminal domain-containing protein [Salinarimonas sp.]|uniref:acyl-CoA dehydrogenase C-terminal domain-containing protein n=1 Tax=Salinarimonas sp. TaxID=2766526 RepID=UPI00391BA67E